MYLHPIGSTAYILQSVSPESLIAAAIPDTKPPPPQHTNTISGFTPSSNISKAALIKKYIFVKIKTNIQSYTLYKKISS